METCIEVIRSRSTRMAAIDRYSRPAKLKSLLIRLSIIASSIMRKEVCSSAVTLALVGAPATKDISPKNSPAPKIASGILRSRSCRSTRHPYHFPLAAWRAFSDWGDRLWQELIGIVGWQDILLPTWTYIALTVLLLIVSLQKLQVSGTTRARVAENRRACCS